MEITSPFFGGGDPSRSEIYSGDKGLVWQNGLTASIESKGLYATLANREMRNAHGPGQGHYHPVVQRDDGGWSIGFHDDAAGPFETRAFALRVACGWPEPAPAGKFRRIRIREVRSNAPA